MSQPDPENRLSVNVPSAEQDHPRTGASDSFDFLEFLWLLRRHLVLFGLTVIIGTVLVWYLTTLFTPQYTATTEILIDPQQSNVVDIETVLTGLGTDSGTIESQVEVITSRTLAERAIDQLGLVEDPEFNGALREPNTYLGRLWADGFLYDIRTAIFGASKRDMDPERRKGAVISAFLNRLVAERQSLTFVIEVSFTSDDPRKAQLIVNTLAELYLLEQYEARLEATRRATAWLDDRLTDLRTDLNAAESAVEAYRTENSLVDAQGSPIIEQQLADMNQQLALLRVEKVEAEAKFDRVNQLVNSGGDVGTLADVLNSTTIANLKRDESDLIQREAELASKYGDLHPELINVRAERADLDAQINLEVGKITESLRNELNVILRREAVLRESVEELKTDVLSNNQQLIELGELERQATSARTIYESFLNRFRETEQQSINEDSDARIISKATIPLGASFPNMKIHLVIGFVFSVVLGVIFALLADRLHNTFRHADDVESELGLPMLGTVPEVRRLRVKRPKLAETIRDQPTSQFSESARSLRTAMMLSNIDTPPKIVALTSSLPSEGKTTTALSIALSSAASGSRTLLVDADMRRPNVATILRLKPQAGIVELLTNDDVQMSDAVVVEGTTGLHVIGVNALPPSPNDLLASKRFEDWIESLRDTYDLVIIDTPPLLPVADTQIISRHVDKVLMVLKWNATPRDIARRAVQDLQRSGAKIAGVALTQVNTAKQASRHYGGYGQSHYYRYSKYYSS